MSSVFGRVFTIATWGESHGGGVGVVIDGCPARIALDEADIQPELDRRRPGQSDLSTPRKEADRCRILSGVFQGHTLGTPICIMVENTDARSADYDENVYRPSHADFTYEAKYGIRNWQGGGRASARETIGRVAAGAVARKVLQHLYPCAEVVAYVETIGDISSQISAEHITREIVEKTPLRCPDPAAAQRMVALIRETQAAGNSLGGIAGCIVRRLPASLGEPIFDKLDADLAKAMMSIPATKGFEIGSGFAGSAMRGSEHNDSFILCDNRISTATNHSGGVQGGISNGEPITMRIAFKPTATIAQPQKTLTAQGESIEFSARGRHDACVLPRAIPIIEAMAWLVLCDHALRQKIQQF